MLAIKNVLVATDFSECAETALGYAREFSRAFAARLHVLHVTATIVPDAMAMAAGVPVAGVQDEINDSDRQQLEQLVTADDRASLRATAVALSGERPEHAISEYAREHDIDLIVVGTHGRSGLSHLIMGSVAEHIVRIAPCPVLVVRQQQRAFVTPDAASCELRAR